MHHLQLRGPPHRSQVPLAVSACESLLWEAVMTCVCLSVSPVLGAVVCPVSSLLLKIQEELLLFQFLLLVTCY